MGINKSTNHSTDQNFTKNSSNNTSIGSFPSDTNNNNKNLKNFQKNIKLLGDNIKLDTDRILSNKEDD